MSLSDKIKEKLNEYVKTEVVSKQNLSQIKPPSLEEVKNYKEVFRPISNDRSR